MEYLIHCPNKRCGKTSPPTAEQLAFIEQSAAKGMDFIAVECPICKSRVFFNPQNADGTVPKKVEILIPCPCETCYEFVVLVEGKDRAAFWACGGCGTQWTSRGKLDVAIDHARKRHPYRAAVYQRAGDHWESVPMNGKIHKDYMQKVIEEFNNQ
jgi:hypothetical protein